MNITILKPAMFSYSNEYLNYKLNAAEELVKANTLNAYKDNTIVVDVLVDDVNIVLQSWIDAVCEEYESKGFKSASACRCTHADKPNFIRFSLTLS